MYYTDHPTPGSTLRDPAARRRATGMLVAMLFIWPLLVVSEFKPVNLLDLRNLQTIGGFLSGFMPPAVGREFLGYLFKATLETVAIATAGIALAFLLATPLAIASTHALSISRIGPHGGRWRREVLRFGIRNVLVVLRGVPVLVWALVFVRVFGLGPTAGVLAIGLTYGGMLAKVYAEIFESGDTRPARAILEAGGSRLQALLYGLLPCSGQELTSYTVYRWECAIRTSVVMGFVGAGGLGQLMDQAMKMLNGGEAATILLMFFALVIGADLLSAFLRKRVGNAGTAGHTSAIGPVATAILILLPVSITASFFYLDLAMGSLLTLEAMQQIGVFFGEFFPPDLSDDWLRKVAIGSFETVAISTIGTLLAVLGALVLALPASGRFGKPLENISRLFLNGLRSIPELVWATVMALAAGLGPFAGVLALALHTTGVLGRLFAEALQNAPSAPRDALTDAGASPSIAFLYGTVPVVSTQFISYTLYRWEMNIRMAAVLGFVGAGGLGQLLYVELSLFHYAQSSTIIAAMLLLSVAIDQTSGWLRKQLCHAAA